MEHNRYRIYAQKNNTNKKKKWVATVVDDEVLIKHIEHLYNVQYLDTEVKPAHDGYAT